VSVPDAAPAARVRVGVDVGGTFTKAVAFDLDAGRVVAQAVVPTSHTAAEGVAAGVVECVAEVVRETGPERVELVTHSTTQAVNALLEGDVGTVGVIGIGRRPDLRKVAKRTRLAAVELAPGKRLRTAHEVLDVTDGLDPAAVEQALDRLVAAGAETIAVAEAFSPDDDSNEQAVVAQAVARGLPVCASTELTGLYGLELRAVTAAINASIVPIALQTADVVERGVAGAGIGSPVMVMRGDGGATDLTGFRAAPVRTLYSGPAASVAGALRHSRFADGVVVEVGGTSTNVAAIKRGHPALSYVTVGSHATALRSIDVRVVGVAGGSMLRTRRRKVYGVGPRSAHIAGLPYACFSDPAELTDLTVEEIAPRPGDAPDYLVVRSGDRRVALTNTCAANLLGIVEPDDYAAGSQEAARLAFTAAGAHLKLAPEEVARRMLEASGNAVAQLVGAVAHDHDIGALQIVAVGGGAGGLGRHVAALLGVPCTIPPDAEVISSVGDALSLVRAARERTIADPTAADVDALVADVEDEAVAAGAGPATIEVRIEYVADRKALRAVATGSIGLEAGALPGRSPLTEPEIQARATEQGFAGAAPAGAFWVATRDEKVLVLDRFGDVVVDTEGEVVRAGAAGVARDEIGAAIDRRTRTVGPMSVTPSAWVLRGTRLTELGSGTLVDAVVDLAGSDPDAAVVVGRG
jgi:N-methylhydantoinase A/oxoprolinase/acetone carboxylase beta subunit